ncbi:MAG TPA: aminoacyl-tRNA hydrolase [Myxococcota bacterium]|jgi:PTH1 family peptidyl-tRNA hydrolase|nr:aminoacyl-tRNA hydrolase [Myxococcota bacterium]
MKLVVGLGNPGRRYAGTRHNVGFRVVERFAGKRGISLDQRKFEGRFGRGRVAGGDVGILAPETFMNLSGRSVAEALRLLPVGDPREDLLVVFDDVDLPFGKLRLRPGGGAGGHKGLRDIIERIGRDDFPRLRFGVGRPPHPGQETADWVLTDFADAEQEELAARLDDAACAVEAVLADGLESAMNRWNRDAGRP